MQRVSFWPMAQLSLLGAVEENFYIQNERARQSLPLLNLLYCWCPFFRCRAVLPYSVFFGLCVQTFESFFANDNYSNMHSNGCACLIETVEINILNILFFQLMKHLITL